MIDFDFGVPARDAQLQGSALGSAPSPRRALGLLVAEPDDPYAHRKPGENYLAAWMRLKVTEDPQGQAMIQALRKVQRTRMLAAKTCAEVFDPISWEIVDPPCGMPEGRDADSIKKMSKLDSRCVHLHQSVSSEMFVRDVEKAITAGLLPADARVTQEDVEGWQQKRALFAAYRTIKLVLAKDCADTRERIDSTAPKSGKSDKVFDTRTKSDRDSWSSFSLPAGPDFACPNATEICRSCYAQVGPFLADSVLQKNVDNWVWVNLVLDRLIQPVGQGALDPRATRDSRAAQDPIEACADRLRAMVLDAGSVAPSDERRKALGPNFKSLYRLHVAGDFFRPEYIEAWHRVVTHPSCAHILFWTYTRSFRADFVPGFAKLVAQPNFRLWASTDAVNYAAAVEFVGLPEFGGRVGLAVGPISTAEPEQLWSSLLAHDLAPDARSRELLSGMTAKACPADAFEVLTDLTRQLRASDMLREALLLQRRLIGKKGPRSKKGAFESSREEAEAKRVVSETLAAVQPVVAYLEEMMSRASIEAMATVPFSAHVDLYIRRADEDRAAEAARKRGSTASLAPVSEYSRLVNTAFFAKKVRPFAHGGRLAEKGEFLGIKYESDIMLALLKGATSLNSEEVASELTYAQRSPSGACNECRLCLPGGKADAILFYAQTGTMKEGVEELTRANEPRIQGAVRELVKLRAGGKGLSGSGHGRGGLGAPDGGAVMVTPPGVEAVTPPAIISELSEALSCVLPQHPSWLGPFEDHSGSTWLP